MEMNGINCKLLPQLLLKRLRSALPLLPSRISDYLLSLRPWSFSASCTPVSIGVALSYKKIGSFDLGLFMATLITVLSVHAAVNLVNTYFDYTRRIDSKNSDHRTLVDHMLTPEEVANMCVMFYILGCSGFFIVVYLSHARMELLALMYFVGLSLSFLYSGCVSLKYNALGNLIVTLTFGPVSVLFSFFAQTGTLELVPLTYAIPFTLNMSTILHTNKSRDIEIDRRTTLIGHLGSHILFSLSLFVPYILFMVTSFHSTYWLLLPLITLPKAFRFERRFRSGNLSLLSRDTAKLNLYFGLFYLVACCVTDPNRLPGISQTQIIN